MNWYDDPQYLKDELKTLSEGEATYALREAWHNIYGEYPSDKSLAILWAQSALETGRWKSMHNYNWGNIKKKHAPNDDGHYFTMFRCNELINKRLEWFNPPHIQTHFRAYKSATDGAEDYIKFLAGRTRYAKAWAALKAGDPAKYSHELKMGGYYTASEVLYTTGVVRLCQEFLRKAPDLLQWRPPEPIPEPSPHPAIPPPPPSEEPEIIPAPPKLPDDMVDTLPAPPIPSEPIPNFKPPKKNIVQAGFFLGLITLVLYLLERFFN